MAALRKAVIGLLKSNHVFRNPVANYQSVYSLEKIYPDSRFDFSTSIDEKIKSDALKSQDFHGYIPMEQLQVTYTRSSAPGGQNVNKSNSKVRVRFHMDTATFISERIKSLLKEKCPTRITKDGYFCVESEKTRTSSYNLADCLDKLRYLIRNIDVPHREITPEEQQILDARSRKATQDRLRRKREMSLKKQARTLDY